MGEVVESNFVMAQRHRIAGRGTQTVLHSLLWSTRWVGGNRVAVIPGTSAAALALATGLTIRAEPGSLGDVVCTYLSSFTRYSLHTRNLCLPLLSVGQSYIISPQEHHPFLGIHSDLAAVM